MQCRCAKILDRIVYENFCATHQASVLATHRPPDQRAVFRVEFLDTAVGLDHFRAGHTDATLLGHSQCRATPRRSDRRRRNSLPGRPPDPRPAPLPMRASISARMISAIASSPALASCNLTPPVSNSTSSGDRIAIPGCARRPVSLAPCTSPMAPPMKRPSCAATNTGPPPMRHARRSCRRRTVRAGRIRTDAGWFPSARGRRILRSCPDRATVSPAGVPNLVPTDCPGFQASAVILEPRPLIDHPPSSGPPVPIAAPPCRGVPLHR